VDLANVSRVTTMGELTASPAHEDQPIAAAVTNADTCLRWLAHNQPDLEEAREATESAWCSLSAGPSLNCTAAVCGLRQLSAQRKLVLHPGHQNGALGMTPEETLTVFVIDDDAAVRASIQGLLKAVELALRSLRNGGRVPA
jgi:hypothetical protein